MTGSARDFAPRDDLELPLVEPHALATKAFVNTNIAEGNLLKLHAALRATHEVKRALSLALLHGGLLPLLFSESSQSLDFLPDEVFLFVEAGLDGHGLSHIVRQQSRRLRASGNAAGRDGHEFCKPQDATNGQVLSRPWAGNKK